MSQQARKKQLAVGSLTCVSLFTRICTLFWVEMEADLESCRARGYLISVLGVIEYFGMCVEGMREKKPREGGESRGRIPLVESTRGVDAGNSTERPCLMQGEKGGESRHKKAPCTEGGGTRG